MFDLSGKVALITGGSGVLGFAMAKSLCESSVKVIILGRTREKIDNKVNQLQEFGTAAGYACDVLNEERVREVDKQVLDEFGQIDILINAAGGNIPGATILPDQSVFDMPIDDFKKVNELNLTGTVLPSIVFGKSMAERGKGCIINISSMAAYIPLTRVVGYSAAKASVDSFTKWLAVELATKFGEGLRVNAIAPGFFITEQNKRLLTNDDGSLTERGKSVIDNTPAGRFGEPEELNSTVHWLCSDSSSFVTGAVIPVDGGFSSFAGV